MILFTLRMFIFLSISYGVCKSAVMKRQLLPEKKDVTLKLLDHYGFQYSSVGHSGAKSRMEQLKELAVRDWTILRKASKFKPDIIFTRNPAGVQVARLIGAIGIFDTDDGIAAGIHFKAAAPFADVITTPDCLNENHGKKHIKYPGYKQGAYLHPDHFLPDPAILKLLSVQPGRFSFWFVLLIWSLSMITTNPGLDINQEQR